MKRILTPLLVATTASLAGPAVASESEVLKHVFELQYAMDTFYFLVCGALVMWMAAGFSMLEAGLVRSKNTVEILTKNVALFAISCIMYLICGYAIMYGGGIFLSGIDGGDKLVDEAFQAFAEREDGFGGDSIYSGASDFFFQVVFVATAMSIVSGAVAERMKLWAFLAFAIVMTGFIYPMEGSWTWGENDVLGLYNLGDLGFSDFAGSGIVHMAGAAAALAGVMLLGARKGKYGPNGEVRAIPGANLPLATLGTFILWMGWFGFNGASQLAMGTIDDVADVSRIFVNTNIAASAGAVAALILTQLIYGKVDLTMVLNGALAGLVSITAEPLMPSIPAAFLIGAIGGVIVVVTVPMLDKFKIDDVVGAIPVHLIAGIWGTLIVPATNSDASYITQLVGVVSIGAFVFVASMIVWMILKATMGIRASDEAQISGLDISEMGMEAYPDFVQAK